MANLLKDSRKFIRFPVSIPVTLDEKLENSSTICSNISQKGIYLETSEKIKKGDLLCLNLTLNPKTQPVKVLGEVMWAVSTKTKDYTNKNVKGFGVKFLANFKDNLHVHQGILEKERWKPSPEKENLELHEDFSKNFSNLTS